MTGEQIRGGCRVKVQGPHHRQEVARLHEIVREVLAPDRIRDERTPEEHEDDSVRSCALGKKTPEPEVPIEEVRGFDRKALYFPLWLENRFDDPQIHRRQQQRIADQY